MYFFLIYRFTFEIDYMFHKLLIQNHFLKMFIKGVILYIKSNCKGSIPRHFSCKWRKVSDWPVIGRSECIGEWYVAMAIEKRPSTRSHVFRSPTALILMRIRFLTAETKVSWCNKEPRAFPIISISSRSSWKIILLHGLNLKAEYAGRIQNISLNSRRKEILQECFWKTTRGCFDWHKRLLVWPNWHSTRSNGRGSF